MTESPTEKPKRRKICKEDVEAVCKMVAKGLTERESVANLGIKEMSWHKWKSRHLSKFDHVFQRIKANRINFYLNRIEKHAEGSPDDGIKSDWRAAESLLKLTDARFRDKPQEQPQQGNQTLVLVSDSIAANVFAGLLGQPKEPKMIDLPKEKP